MHDAPVSAQRPLSLARRVPLPSNESVLDHVSHVSMFDVVARFKNDGRCGSWPWFVKRNSGGCGG